MKVRHLVRLGSFSSFALLMSCGVSSVKNGAGSGDASKTSSISMPVPDKIKTLIGPDKINGYSLSINPGTCDSGLTGTTVNTGATKLELAGASLVNTKIKQGCAYTVTISLGKMDSAGKTLQKIYLTNDMDGKKTQIPIEMSRNAQIKITAILFVTADGQSDLGINGGQPVPVPSTGSSDVAIGVEIGNSTNNQSGTPLAGDYDWQKSIAMDSVKVYPYSGKTFGSKFYQDVFTHTDDRDFQGGSSTHVHETIHGIHAQMRNARPGQGFAFFYFENGKGIYVKEPVENAKDVRNHIADSFKQLANSRYNTYLISASSSWTNTLYIFDEWGAYVGTTRAAVEVYRAGQWEGPSVNADPLEGVVDFMYFCSAAILSIKNVDPNYLSTNTQFKAAFGMLMEQSAYWLAEGQKESIWKGSSSFAKMDNFKNAADASEVRAAVKQLMGDVWTKRVLGF